MQVEARVVVAGQHQQVGSNAAWCHPVLFQRMLKNKQERGARIVVSDPRDLPMIDRARGAAPGSAAQLDVQLDKAETYEGEGYVIVRHEDTAVVKRALGRVLELIKVEMA